MDELRNNLESDVIYFELNNWEAGRDYPDAEPFISFVERTKDKNYYINFDDEKWIKDNKVIVLISIVDMSSNYCVSAKRSWVEEKCPELLTKYREFIVIENEGKVLGQFGCPFIKYDENKVGLYLLDEAGIIMKVSNK